MATQYAGGTLSNTLTTVTSKATLFTAISTGLLAAGWTIVTTNSSVDKIFQCVATPQGNQICVRVYDSGGSTQCIRLSMMNTAQSILQANSCYLYPSSSANYRVIADQYQFAIFVPGSLSSRNFCFASALYLPPFLVTFGVTTSAFIIGDGQSDTDTSNTVGSFRTSLNARGLVGFAPSQGWSLINSTAVEYNGIAADSSVHPGFPTLISYQSSAIQSISGYRWHDDSAMIIEPLVAWGAPTYDSEAKIRGQLWDAILSTESYPSDTTTLIDSHTYYTLTNNNDGNATLPCSMRGTLLHVSA